MSLARYAVFGLPLGFIGLPLYVHLPKYYAEQLPLTLASIGAVMFLARLLDCLADPWIGRLSDRHPTRRRRMMLGAGMVVALGVMGLFLLPLHVPATWVMPSLALLLIVTYLAYSVLAINYYAFGLAHGRDAASTTRVSAAREAAIAGGVLFASALPILLMPLLGTTASYLAFACVVALLVALGLGIAWRSFVLPSVTTETVGSPWAALKANPALRWVYALFLCNAIPPSITATLFLFYVSDLLVLPEMGGAFLGIYFLAAIVALPVWTRIAQRIGKRRSLIASMLLALASFSGAGLLGAGDMVPFLVICVLSGVALGGDLAVLPSLLADALGEKESAHGGLAFGIWHFISKFTLAMAAGIALPALDMAGYVPGESGSTMLRFGYAWLPCLFKLGALTILMLSPIDQPRRKV